MTKRQAIRASQPTASAILHIESETLILASRSKNVQSVTTSLVVPIVLLIFHHLFRHRVHENVIISSQIQSSVKTGYRVCRFSASNVTAAEEIADVGAGYHLKVVHFDDVLCFRVPTETQRFSEI